VRRIPVLILAVGVILALVGCTSANPTPVSPAHAVVTKAIPVADGVIGTGTFTSWNGRTTGTLRVVAKAGKFALVLSHFATDFTGESLFVLADTPLTMSQCGEKNLWQIGLSTMHNNVIEPTMTFPLLEDGNDWSDPTFFKTFAFLQYPAAGPDGNVAIVRGCEQPIVALTGIHWTMKSIYPALTVRDRGAALGAQGVVANKDGKPFSYRTAPDDTWQSIAHRFGLTSAELVYLNPIRHPSGQKPEAYQDQVLNLSPGNRGNSESRRPGAQ
jgi:hypothetical protein